MDILSKIDLKKVPRHVAIIMDGNGRWAKKQGEVRLFGHSSGVEAVREVLKGCVDLGVRYLTLYAFSTAESKTNLLAGHISTPIPSPSIKGITGLSPTFNFPLKIFIISPFINRKQL